MLVYSSKLLVFVVYWLIILLDAMLWAFSIARRICAIAMIWPLLLADRLSGLTYDEATHEDDYDIRIASMCLIALIYAVGYVSVVCFT